MTSTTKRTFHGLRIVHVLLLCGGCVLPVLNQPVSHAAVCSDSPTAFIQTSQAASPGAVATVTGGDFSLFAWVNPSDLNSPEAGHVAVHGGLQIHLLADGSVRARLLSNSHPPLTATAAANMQPNEWSLLALSYVQQEGRLDVWVLSESTAHGGPKHGSAVNRNFAVGPAGSVRIGNFDSAPAMLGTYGAIALRNHAITALDVLTLWDSRLHLGAYSINNLTAGGSMNGPDGCIYMINHAVTTKPINIAQGVPPAPAAVVGEPSTRWNFHVFDRLAAGASNSLRAVRLLNTAEGFTNCTPYDPPGDGFFVKPLPTLSQPLPEPHYVSGQAPLLRRLAAGPAPGGGLLRVMTSANSRAVLASDGSTYGTSNYAHGFIMLNLAQTAGVLNRPAQLDANLPWFGFDTRLHAPYTEGEIAQIRFHNFSRFWTGANSSGSLGPGEGVHLSPPGSPSSQTATFTMRCKPEGMMTAEDPLVMRAYLLRFPGASDVVWTPNLHSQQGEPGTDVGEPSQIMLNTQTWTHTFDPAVGDSITSNGFILTLSGNLASSISINDAVQVGPCINVVKHVSYNSASNTTNVDFEHAISVLPSSGDVLRFGSWGYEVIEYEWPGVNPASEDVWRGLRLSTAGDGQGVVLFAFSAWRPNVDGFAFGTAGWAGRGYEWQTARSFSAALAGWMQLLAPDVWLQMFAQQQSQPFHMSVYANAIKSALPDIEIAWLGDFEHEIGGTYEDWHRYILENAEDEQLIACSALMHPRIGAFDALLDDGLRSDANHMSERGNIRLAEVWTEQLSLAAIDPDAPLCLAADLNCDGVVDGFDLVMLLSAWGPCGDCAPGYCPGDLNGDCLVNGFDLTELLSQWGQTP